MSEETVEAEPELGWKLIKETLPPGFLNEAAWARENKTVSMQSRSLRYLSFLFDNETGLYGNRPGNRWRLSRRKFLESYVWVQDKMSQRFVRFRLNEAQRLQEAAVLRRERAGLPVRFVDLKARQHGTSTHIAGVCLELLLRNKHARALLMGHKKDSATVIQGRMRDMIGYLRRKDGSNWNISLDLDNRKETKLGPPVRSVVIVDSAEGPDYRGDTLRFFHAIEPAEWPNAEDKANAVIQVVPQAPGTYIFIEGTARGETGWFAETWKGAAKRQRESGDDDAGMQALFFPWFIHQNYRWSIVNRKPLSERKRAEIEATLDADEQRLLTQQYVRRGVGLVTVDFDQLAWRRYAIPELCQDSLAKFHQEYPAYPDEAFLSTGMKFFDAGLIAAQRATNARDPAWRGDILDEAGERKMARTLTELEASP